MSCCTIHETIQERREDVDNYLKICEKYKVKPDPSLLSAIYARTTVLKPSLPYSESQWLPLLEFLILLNSQGKAYFSELRFPRSNIRIIPFYYILNQFYLFFQIN